MTKNQIDFVSHKEQQRHNLATESEASRHNKQQEGIGWYGASVQEMSVREAQRHNLTDEEIQRTLAEHRGTYWDNLAEAAVQNAATNAYNAGLRGDELQEAIRHNLVQEGFDASRAQSYANMATASLQQAETAERKRTDEWGHQLLNIGAGAISQGVHETSSLAQSILRGLNGGK